jgi:WD40 repeat protein
MAFVPGGKYLATAGGGVLSVWDADTGRIVRTISTDGHLGQGGFLGRFAFTPDGKYILSTDPFGSKALGAGVSSNSQVLLWGLSSGKVLMQSEATRFPGALAIRDDARMGACATLRGDVFLWDLEEKVVRRAVVGRGLRTIHALSFARDGKHLVVLPSEGGLAKRIDVASGKVLKEVELGGSARVALASGEGTIATYDHPNELCLYDTSTGKKRRLPLKEKVGYLDLSFGPDGRTLLAKDRLAEVVQFWDVADGQLLRRLRVSGLAGTDQHAELVLSGDGERLASHDKHRVVRIWDARTGQPRLRLPGHVLSPDHLAFSLDGKEVVSYAPWDQSLGGQLYRWDATTGKLLTELSPEAPEGAWGGSDMSSRLAGGGHHLGIRLERATYIYEVGTGKRLVVAEKALPDSDWTFTPDNRTVATLVAEQDIRLWDITTGKLLRAVKLEKEGTPISWLRFTPDGRTLVTGESWQKLHLWDAATGKHRATLTLPAEREPYQEPLQKWLTAFTPDGRYLFTSNTTNLWVWDLVARREIGPFEVDKHSYHRVCSGPVAVSPDGRLMAWFDPAFKLRLYEVCTGRIVYRFEDKYSSIAFPPSGWRLATGCEPDSSILLWDLPLLFRSQPLAAKDTSPEALWELLKSDDAVQAHAALWRLASLPEADALLSCHVHPVEVAPPERVRALLADLGSSEYARREAAEKALAAAGEAVSAALAEASAKTKDPEVRRRVAGLQKWLQPRMPQRLREVRAVLVLEARGTAEARRLLQRLAGGAPEARLTQEAKMALGRLPR